MGIGVSRIEESFDSRYDLIGPPPGGRGVVFGTVLDWA